jgi:predicted nucleotidyltransferase
MVDCNKKDLRSQAFDSKNIGEIMINLENLKKTLQAHKEELKVKYGVTEIGVFGSCVKNEQNDMSDVDILVDFNKAIDLFTFVI